ncbi:MAG TPA: hypothetical protein VKR32_07285, partial [Puia sp.]|nr:hypothetical protein [Puia sp.]
MRGKILIALVSLLPFFGIAQPKNWQNLDLQRDSVFGISTEKAYTELLKGKTSQTVVVAVIDGGIDTAQEDLKAVLWHNPAPKAFDNGTYGCSFVCSDNGEVYVDNNEETVVVREFERGDVTKLHGRDLAAYKKAKQTLQEELQEARRSIRIQEKMVDSLYAERAWQIRAFEQQDTTRLSESSRQIYHAKMEDMRRLTEARSWKQLGGKSIDSLFGIKLRNATPPPYSQTRIVCSIYFMALRDLVCQLNTAYDPFPPGKQRHYDC